MPAAPQSGIRTSPKTTPLGLHCRVHALQAALSAIWDSYCSSSQHAGGNYDTPTHGLSQYTALFGITCALLA
ncbi:hypothetical protein PHISCL_00235 [Aspergillus sclerotialis]|uniref:Uncharacterized protein n=1 Tax=Aspergillus sclerotialis TaxID=2070753 RepID=A0A3A3ADV9_9EURO|nr:hypothetical protein PHISCL_00235 [Aspergillus sclerotialis]